MKNYYCLDLKFKDERISDKEHHAHLFVSDKEIYIQIIENDITSRIDAYYSNSENPLGLFEENFHIIDSKVSLIFDKSRIYKVLSFQTNDQYRYFTIWLTTICIIKDNTYKENINSGIAFLNKNGLQVVNEFYSFFTNHRNKNIFSISRMDGMSNFYKIDNMSFRPELEYTSNEHRGSEEFTVKKKGTINFKFENIDYDEIKHHIEIICNLFSFFFNVRVKMEKLIFRTEKDIYIFRDTEPNNQTYVSDMETVSIFLKKNNRIENFLKKKWYIKYSQNEKKISKAIDNILHSREVDFSSAFLLLFNIIEIFNIKQDQEKFAFNTDKKSISDQVYKSLKNYLVNKKDQMEFEKKIRGTIDKLEFKPFKSPLEETLRLNNVDPTIFGYTFAKLKKTRDSITHGSLNSIKPDQLQLQVYCLRKIAICIVLSQLGFKNDLNKEFPD
ncbi:MULTISPECIES: HEPN domain-containing protein [unclassified Chryseobacterium]|uniref:HEPN domain-containing protein n=1 Tax=unclassified Chryseobacterium TaxID=2593645 RepID=UPI00100AE602|nr:MULTISPECIES: HEPN domain-containing protein [unclassified Chryseobacterium]RXM52983.1 hypothetical protein BOQ64_00800 [Chryseobacterium sp. CH25]RXM65823.1 hypothetical protein BOQ60_08715 [Chryseobacterium sp. CH1]